MFAKEQEHGIGRADRMTAREGRRAHLKNKDKCTFRI
jgi:hypothetical protein